MVVTLLGMVTLVRLVQEENAPLPDGGDAVGDGERAGQDSRSRTCQERGQLQENAHRWW